MSNPSLAVNEKEIRKFEHWISLLLRTGVYSSILLLLLAAALNTIAGRSSLSSSELKILLGGEGTFHADAPLQSMRFIQAAILILIILPGLRVAFMMGSFFRQRDYIFGFLSMIVLLAMSIGTLFRILA